MTFLECNEKKEGEPQGRITKQQAHTLKLKMSLFAESTAMIEWAKGAGENELLLALAERDRAREDVYKLIDELTTEE